MYRVASILLTLMWAAVCGLPECPAKADTATDSGDIGIIRVDRAPIRVGRYSAFSGFEDRLRNALQDCADLTHAAEVAQEPPGVMTTRTSGAIRALLACPRYRFLSKSLAAANGALTTKVWKAIMGDEAPPTLSDRIDALTLTFEATDFGGPPEWNFCADSPDALAVAKSPTTQACINETDPCSLLTWGPRGATAGQGNEIQWVLGTVLRGDRAILDREFGSEMKNVERFLTLKAPKPDSCDGTAPLEYFMCAVWLDPDRRAIWETALSQLGADQLVRDVFNRTYHREEFDGYKLRSYFDFWHTMNLEPTEIDFAFFYDRATHQGAAPDAALSLQYSNCLKDQTSALNRNAAARRCLSRNDKHPTMPQDRLARDVVFYIDGYTPGTISREEIEAWSRHMPLHATSNFMLSDTRPAPALRDTDPALDGVVKPALDSSELTERERACPAEIRQPKKNNVGRN